MKATLGSFLWRTVRYLLPSALFLFFLVLCLWPAPFVNDLPEDVRVSDLRVLEDPANSGEAKKLLDSPQAFHQEGAGKIPQGVGGATVWCLLDVTNLSDQAHTLYLSVDNPTVDDLVLHIAHADGRMEAAESGDAHANRPMPEVAAHAFPFALAGGERATLLLRSRTEVGSRLVPVRVLDRVGLGRIDHARTFLHGGMLGLLAALLVCSALSARSLRDDAYGYFAGYLLCVAVVAAGLTGAGYTTFWTGNVWMSNQGLLMFECLGKVFLLLFTRRFLEDNDLPLVRGLLRFGLAAAVALVVVSAVFPAHAAYRLVTSVLLGFPGLTLLAGALAWRQGRPHAFFYILGQIAAWSGMGVFMLIGLGHMRNTMLTFEIVPFSICLDAMLLTMALADKLTLRQKNTLRLEVEARKSLEIRREELERLVAERTAELAKARDRAEDLARTDALTGVYNRRHMKDIGSREFSRSVRYGTHLSVVVFDIDNFKSVNDRFGHDEGDRILQRIASVVSSQIRQADVFFRWGGEEFLLLLPETPLDEARRFTERLRRMVEVNVQAGGDARPVTASFGVAARLGEDENLSRLITRADKALYKAKACGRNQVVCQTD